MLRSEKQVSLWVGQFRKVFQRTKLHEAEQIAEPKRGWERKKCEAAGGYFLEENSTTTLMNSQSEYDIKKI